MAYELGVAYYIKNMATGKYLNIYGNEQVSDGRTVNTHTFEAGANAQRWIVRLCGEGGKIFSALSPTNYALNINQYENNRCTIWPASGNNNNADAVLDVLTVDRTNNIYKIKMLGSHNKFLTDMNTPDYSYAASNKVHWTDTANGDYSLWKFCTGQCPGDSSTPITPPDTEYSDSSLVDVYIPAYSGNYTSGRVNNGNTISEICIHHTAGVITLETLGNLWQTVGRNGSSHYGVCDDRIGKYVSERDIAWTNGDWNANCRSVTIEVCNSAGAPNWPISNASLAKVTQLVADIAERNNLGKLTKGQNVTWHSMYAATECPGPYLLDKIQQIVDGANAINGYE